MSKYRIDCKVDRREVGPYRVSLNGVDVSRYITKFSFSINGVEQPEVVLHIPVSSFESNTEELIFHIKREIAGE